MINGQFFANQRCGIPMRIVLCYPVEPHHVAQIQAAAPEAEVVDAGQEGIARELPSADIFIGHAKVPVPWDEVVEGGRLQWIQSSAAGLDHCLVPSVIASAIRVPPAHGHHPRQPRQRRRPPPVERAAHAAQPPELHDGEGAQHGGVLVHLVLGHEGLERREAPLEGHRRRHLGFGVTHEATSIADRTCRATTEESTTPL